LQVQSSNGTTVHVREPMSPFGTQTDLPEGIFGATVCFKTTDHPES
jgi:hypothetical protein